MRESLAAAVLLTVVAAGAAGAEPLELAAESRVGTDLSVRVTARNRGPAPLADVRPEVGYERATYPGDPLRGLAPGEGHTWTFALPAPSAPGSFSLTIRAEYRDGDRSETALLVDLVATPGAPTATVGTALDVGPVTGYGHAHLTLDNGGDQPVVGRAIVLLPRALDTEPESRPVQIAPHSRTEVPIDVRNRDALPGRSYPLFIVFEYESDGIHQTLLRGATLDVRPVTDRPVRPLVVGGFALLLAVTLVVGAVRHTRRSAPA